MGYEKSWSILVHIIALEFKEGDNERNSEGYVQGRERMIRLFVGQLCVESAYVRERRPAP